MAKLSGKWTLRAVQNEAGWQQRIFISGSSAHDGPHPMVLGATIPHVEGNAINIIAQAFNPSLNVWIDSLIQEAMNWDNTTGLQVTISADDNPPYGDLDFNDLVVLCTAEDAPLASPLAGPRPDLTIPERFFKWREANPEHRPAARKEKEKTKAKPRPKKPGRPSRPR
jgi:hypothetical protein